MSRAIITSMKIEDMKTSIDIAYVQNIEAVGGCFRLTLFHKGTMYTKQVSFKEMCQFVAKGSSKA